MRPSEHRARWIAIGQDRPYERFGQAHIALSKWTRMQKIRRYNLNEVMTQLRISAFWGHLQSITWSLKEWLTSSSNGFSTPNNDNRVSSLPKIIILQVNNSETSGPREEQLNVFDNAFNFERIILFHLPITQHIWPLDFALASTGIIMGVIVHVQFLR